MTSFLTLVAKDFLSHIPQTAHPNKYSPKAAALAKAARLAYTDGNGGRYAVDARHMLEAAELLNIEISTDGRIAVSADALNHRASDAVFDESKICRHGPAPYCLLDNDGVPVRKPCCTRCPNSFQEPTASDIATAEQFYAGTATSLPMLGALILVGRALGFTTSRTLGGVTQLSLTVADFKQSRAPKRPRTRKRLSKVG